VDNSDNKFTKQKTFWVHKDEQNYGPYDDSEIRKFIQEKRLTSEEYIYDERKSSWSQIDEIFPSHFKRFIRIIQNPIFLLLAWIINMLLIVELVSDFDVETIEFSVLGFLHVMYLVLGFVCIFIPFFFKSFLGLIVYYMYTWVGSLISTSIGWTGLILLIKFYGNDNPTGLGSWLIMAFFVLNAVLGTLYLGSLILGKIPVYIKISLGIILLVLISIVWPDFLKIILLLGAPLLGLFLIIGIFALFEKLFDSTNSATTTKDKMTKTQANLIIILLLVALGFPFLGILKPTPKWEYKIENPLDMVFSTSMNNYGDDGWELVAARRASSPLGPAYECIFKRPK
jgi:hypothetical protein